MNYSGFTVLAGLLSFFINIADAAQAKSKPFVTLNETKNWQLIFHSQGHWQNDWFLDGQKAVVTDVNGGFRFDSGPVAMDPAHHAVLWTRESFKNSVKIEYEYTRLDQHNVWATMLYIQASGLGTQDSPTDIFSWSDKRQIPYMKTYFQKMNLLHISYAAYAAEDKGVNKDYIRARRYPLKNGGVFSTDTKISGDVFNSGMFRPNQTYQITVIKHRQDLYMQILDKTNGHTRLVHWDTSAFAEINSGRIGLRQMWAKSAIYRHFKVSQLNERNNLN